MSKTIIFKFDHQQARRDFEQGLLDMLVDGKQENNVPDDVYEIIEDEDKIIVHFKSETLEQEDED